LRTAQPPGSPASDPTLFGWKGKGMHRFVRNFSPLGALAAGLSLMLGVTSAGAATSIVSVGGHALGAAGPRSASSVKSPSPRSGMGMAYDAARAEVVLFGGGRSCCSGDYLNDTWTWD